MGKKVLIADDNPTNRQLLCDILDHLKQRGVKFFISKDGAETLDLIRQEHPDLLLLDVMMPEFSGYEICKQIKTDPELREIYVIMVTAKAELQDRRDGLRVGADEYVTKPYDIRLLRERVELALLQQEQREKPPTTAP